VIGHHAGVERVGIEERRDADRASFITGAVIPIDGGVSVKLA